MKADAVQAVGFVGAQYEHVKTQLKALSSLAKSEGATLTATGHSLGGGLTLAAAATGFVDEAVAFNPAGLHDNTIEVMTSGDKSVDQIKSDINAITTSYISRGDLLNNLQDLFSFIVPTALGKRVVVEGGGIHFIDDVVEALNE